MSTKRRKTILIIVGVVALAAAGAQSGLEALRQKVLLLEVRTKLLERKVKALQSAPTAQASTATSQAQQAARGPQLAGMSPAVRNLVEKMTKNLDVAVRRQAVKSLRLLGSDAEAALPALIDILLKDLDGSMRCAAASALPVVAANAPQDVRGNVISALETKAKDRRDATASSGAIRSLARMRPPQPFRRTGRSTR